MTRTERRK